MNDESQYLPWNENPNSGHIYPWWEEFRGDEIEARPLVSKPDSILESDGISQNTSDLTIAPMKERYIALLVDMLLMMATIFVGWIVWFIIISSNGQSPGKQLVGLRVIRLKDNRPPPQVTLLLRDLLWKQMIFWGLALAFVPLSFLGGASPALSYAWLPILFSLTWLIINIYVTWGSEDTQTLWDRRLNTLVVSDQDGNLAVCSKNDSRSG